MLASRAIFRPVAASVRGLATKVAVGGAGGALGSAVLAKIAGGGLGLGDIELKVMGADRLPAASGDVKSISGATNVSGLLGDAKYAILLSGEPAQFQAAGKALAPGAVAGVMGNTNALIVATAAGEDKVVTGITKVAQAEGEAVLASQGSSVSNVIAWGHGVVDVSHATVDGKWALPLAGTALPPTTPSSPEAAADAIVAHMKALASGTDGAWTSMAVPAVGDFGTGSGIFYSVPVICEEGGDFMRVGGVSLSPEVAAAMEKARVALVAEKQAVQQYL